MKSLALSTEEDEETATIEWETSETDLEAGSSNRSLQKEVAILRD